MRKAIFFPAVLLAFAALVSNFAGCSKESPSGPNGVGGPKDLDNGRAADLSAGTV